MAEITEKPAGLASSNALDALPDDLLATPPAYYKFGPTPSAIENPIGAEDVETYCIRVRCTGEHGPLVRKDGERRYERSMAIQAIWKLGDPVPPDPDEEQPGLFDEAGEPTEDNVARPDFSDRS